MVYMSLNRNLRKKIVQKMYKLNNINNLERAKMSKKGKKPDLRVIDKDGLTLKQRQFVREVVKGKLGTQIECYMSVYNVNPDPKTNKPLPHHHVDCSKLMSNPKVALSISKGIERKNASNVATAHRMKEYVLNALMKESKEAESDNARISALSLLGKSIALFTDVSITEERKDSNQIIDDIEVKLDELLQDNPDIQAKLNQISEK